MKQEVIAGMILCTIFGDAADFTQRMVESCRKVENEGRKQAR